MLRSREFDLDRPLLSFFLPDESRLRERDLDRDGDFDLDRDLDLDPGISKFYSNSANEKIEAESKNIKYSIDRPEMGMSQT